MRSLRYGSCLLLAALPWTATWASSHREAPFVTKNAKVDGTDFYMFRSYEPGRDGYVTILANYQPLQDAWGGPNYFTLDPEALYEINVDNNGDAVEDLTFQLRFQNTLQAAGAGATLSIGPTGSQKSLAIPVVSYGTVSTADQSKLNVNETYTLTVVRNGRRSGSAQSVVKTGTTDGSFTKPADNIGSSTFGAGYAAYAGQYVYEVDVPGCTPPAGTKARVFVGQRHEGFAANLGLVFDLVGAPGALSTLVHGTTRLLRGDTVTDSLVSGGNVLGSKNVTTIALELPSSCLVSGGQTVIGGWTTASVRQARVIDPTATYAQPTREGGPWAQVSRLGNPLVNELVIGLRDKDRFNSSEPKDDAQFLDYVQYPVLPAYLELVYAAAMGGPIAPKTFPRNDLRQVFLTGIEDVDTGAGTTGGSTVNVNKNGATCEYLRLNTGIAPTARGAQNSLGATGCFVNGVLKLDAITADGNPDNDCDAAGFPNGRRPGDDVVDIALRVAMGALVPTGADNPSGAVAFTDGAINYDTQFGSAFPYLDTPVAGH